MWLRVNNLWTEVAKASKEEVQWLWGFLCYHDNGKEHELVAYYEALEAEKKTKKKRRRG